mmetsp:Transcript_21498/g.51292  ORF Transcript_21498/g.51292 Transcript_21498/m.51292 type:complete len:497 (+) Transcript_21498:642-2132(+)
MAGVQDDRRRQVGEAFFRGPQDGQIGLAVAVAALGQRQQGRRPAFRSDQNHRGITSFRDGNDGHRITVPAEGVSDQVEGRSGVRAPDLDGPVAGGRQDHPQGRCDRDGGVRAASFRRQRLPRRSIVPEGFHGRVGVGVVRRSSRQEHDRGIGRGFHPYRGVPGALPVLRRDDVAGTAVHRMGHGSGGRDGPEMDLAAGGGEGSHRVRHDVLRPVHPGARLEVAAGRVGSREKIAAARNQPVAVAYPGERQLEGRGGRLRRKDRQPLHVLSVRGAAGRSDGVGGVSGSRIQEHQIGSGGDRHEASETGNVHEEELGGTDAVCGGGGDPGLPEQVPGLGGPGARDPAVVDRVHGGFRSHHGMGGGDVVGDRADVPAPDHLSVADPAGRDVARGRAGPTIGQVGREDEVVVVAVVTAAVEGRPSDGSVPRRRHGEIDNADVVLVDRARVATAEEEDRRDHRAEETATTTATAMRHGGGGGNGCCCCCCFSFACTRVRVD